MPSAVQSQHTFGARKAIVTEHPNCRRRTIQIAGYVGLSTRCTLGRRMRSQADEGRPVCLDDRALGPLYGSEREFCTRCAGRKGEPYRGPRRAERAERTESTSQGLHLSRDIKGGNPWLVKLAGVAAAAAAQGRTILCDFFVPSCLRAFVPSWLGFWIAIRLRTRICTR